MSGVYDFTVMDIHDRMVSLGAWRGQVLLIVNTASRCGFTPQYADLEVLQQRYRERGFSVLAFPCNQFGGHGLSIRPAERKLMTAGGEQLGAGAEADRRVARARPRRSAVRGPRRRVRDVEQLEPALARREGHGELDDRRRRRRRRARRRQRCREGRR